MVVIELVVKEVETMVEVVVDVGVVTLVDVVVELVELVDGRVVVDEVDAP